MLHSKILRMLNESGARFRLHRHPPVTTIEEAREKVPHLTRNLLKTVVFKVKDGDWILAAVNGSDRIHYRLLGDAFGVKRTSLRSVPPERVSADLGFEVGGVGPFPVQSDVKVVFDQALRGIETVFCGSGINTETVEIGLPDLIRITGGEVHPICRAPEP